MPNLYGTHLKGPMYGSDQAAGGLWQDLPIEAMAARAGRFFYDPCMSNSLANNWVTATLTAGTAAMTAGGIQLTHNVANQGPSIRLTAEPSGPVEQALYTGTDPATNDRQTVAAIEARITKTAGTGPGSDGYFGFGTGAAAHILDANGVPTVATIADGCGWLWAATATPAPALWDNGTVRTLATTGLTFPTLPNTGLPGNLYGIRIETTNAPRDIVSWYVNGRKVFTASPTGQAQFTTTMSAHFGIVAEAGAAQTFQMKSFAFGAVDASLV